MARTDASTLAWLTFDVLAYAITVTAIVVAVVTPVSFASRGDWVTVKVGLFLVGVALFGYGALRLWYAASKKHVSDEPNSSTVSREQDSRIQSTIDRRLPIPITELPPESRVSLPTKLFVASLLVLFVSFVMETAFGVGT